MGELYDKLNELEYEDILPMHMPGAKRNAQLFGMKDAVKLDITEVSGFDNLHHASGVINEVQQRAARVYGADEALLLVNGSTAGIIAAVCGATREGDEVLVARNVHRSVINALYLGRLRATYIYPKPVSAKLGIYGAVSADEVEEILAGRNVEEMLAKRNGRNSVSAAGRKIRAVIITSPTYEGIVSDVAAIAAAAHRHGAVLIVDEAHGAHFGLHDAFVQNAVRQGADAVIMSLHKTLPSLTQTALLLINNGRIDTERVRMYWDMMQTTSPSYVLMGSIDRCMSLIEEQGSALFSDYVDRLKKLTSEIRKLRHIRLLETDDISKLVLIVSDGAEFARQLRDVYKIETEMASRYYVIAMTSVGDTDEGYVRFLQALRNLDIEEYDIRNENAVSEAALGERQKSETQSRGAEFGEKYVGVSAPLTIYEALNSETEYAALGECEGRIAKDALCIYPPGINLINPGEIITHDAVTALQDAMSEGLEVLGVSPKFTVKCVRHKDTLRQPKS